MHIKNIIFDLGGVLLHIDYTLTEKAFVELGCKNFGLIYSQAQQTTLFDDYERGIIDEAAFFFKLKNLAHLHVSFGEMKRAWNAMLINFPEVNYNLLRSLQGKYRIFLLSNTNQTHIAAFTHLIEKVCPMAEFESFFERIYFSNYIGLKKPDAAPFLKILLQNSLSAAETLFIDDSVQHVKGALKTGIRAELLPKGKSTKELLEELTIL